MDIMPTETLPPVAIRKLSFKHPLNLHKSDAIYVYIEENVFKQTESVRESLRDKIKTPLRVISGFDFYMLYLSSSVLSRFTEVTDTFLEPPLEYRTSGPGTEEKKEVMMIFIKIDGEYPQVFVVSSDFAWRTIKEEYWDSDFQSIIAKRVLEFKVKDMTTHNLTGSAITQATSYRPGQEDQPTLWSFLGSIVVSYTMPLREKSELYELPCFLTAKGIPKKINTTVGENYIKFKTNLHLESLAALLDKLLWILKDQQNTLDDRRFSVFDHVKIINDKNLIEEYNRELEEMLKKSELNGLHLYHKGWSEATAVTLYSKDHTRLIDLTDSPPLFEVLEDIRSSSRDLSEMQSFHLEFRYDQMSKLITKPPLTFVEGHILTHSGMSVFRHEGKWMQLSCEYLVELDEDFSKIERENTAQRHILPLPWVYSGKDDYTKPKASYVEQIYIQWHIGWPSSRHSKLDLFCQRAHKEQTEGKYNEGYIPFDNIVRSRYPKTGYLLGDRILVKNVELFDILYYTPDKTYLIHVKEGFGNTTRDVCSQIRVSAELLFKNLVSPSSLDILELFFKSACEEPTKSSSYRHMVTTQYMKYGNQNFQQLFKRRVITFVLAYRDTKKGSKQPSSEEYVNPKELDQMDEITVGILIMTGYLKKVGNDIKITDKILLSKTEAKVDMKKMIKDLFYQQNLQDQPILPSSDFPDTAREALVRCDLVSCQDGFVQLKAFNPSTDQIVKTFIPKLFTAFSLLKGTLSRHASILAKLEVVQLFSHFKKFATPALKFELEICSISKKEPGWSTDA